MRGASGCTSVLALCDRSWIQSLEAYLCHPSRWGDQTQMKLGNTEAANVGRTVVLSSRLLPESVRGTEEVVSTVFSEIF